MTDRKVLFVAGLALAMTALVLGGGILLKQRQERTPVLVCLSSKNVRCVLRQIADQFIDRPSDSEGIDGTAVASTAVQLGLGRDLADLVVQRLRGVRAPNDELRGRLLDLLYNIDSTEVTDEHFDNADYVWKLIWQATNGKPDPLPLRIDSPSTSVRQAIWMLQHQGAIPNDDMAAARAYVDVEESGSLVRALDLLKAKELTLFESDRAPLDWIMSASYGILKDFYPLSDSVIRFPTSARDCGVDTVHQAVLESPTLTGNVAIAYFRSIRSSQQLRLALSSWRVPPYQLLFIASRIADLKSSGLSSELLTGAAEALKSDIAKLVRPAHSRALNEIEGAFGGRSAAWDKDLLSDAFQSSPGLGRGISEALDEDVAALIFWVQHEEKTRETEQALSAASSVFGLLITIDSWLEKDDGDLRNLAISLTYLLALDGEYSTPFKYIDRLSDKNTDLRLQMSSCLFLGLIDGKKYAEAFAFARTVRDSTSAMEALKGVDKVDFDQLYRCFHHPIFGPSCAALLALKRSVALKGELALDVDEAGENMNLAAERMSEWFIMTLCDALAHDPALDNRWDTIRAFTSSQLGSETAEFADLLRSERVEAGPKTFDHLTSSSLMNRQVLWSSLDTVIQTAKRRLRVQSLHRQGRDLDAWKLATGEGAEEDPEITSRFVDTKSSDLTNEIADSLLAHADSSRALVNQVVTVLDTGQRPFDQKTLEHLITRLAERGDIDPCLRIYNSLTNQIYNSLTDSNSQQTIAPIIADSLARSGQPSRLISFLSSLHGNQFLPVVLRVLPRLRSDHWASGSSGAVRIAHKGAEARRA
jgi:hypothetical protein